MAHSREKSEYTAVFTPKCKKVYAMLKEDLGRILEKLCENQKMQPKEARTYAAHPHMSIRIPPK